MSERDFIMRKDGWGIQLIGPYPVGGDIHDTFKVDHLGNITGGHTKIQLPNNKKKTCSGTRDEIKGTSQPKTLSS